jgi:hypothetical protein
MSCLPRFEAPLAEEYNIKRNHDMRSATGIALFTFALTVPLASSCKQSEGDRCQVSSDCEEGLICVVNKTNRALGGNCYPESKYGQTPDGAVSSDAIIDKGPTIDKTVTADKSTAKDGPAIMDTKPSLDTQPKADSKQAVDTKKAADTKAPVDTKVPTDTLVPADTISVVDTTKDS